MKKSKKPKTVFEFQVEVDEVSLHNWDFIAFKTEKDLRDFIIEIGQSDFVLFLTARDIYFLNLADKLFYYAPKDGKESFNTN